MKNRNRLQLADGSDFFVTNLYIEKRIELVSAKVPASRSGDFRCLFLASAETNDKFLKASFQSYQVTVEAVAAATVSLDGTCELSHRITSLSVYLEAISLLMGVPPSENLISYSVITFPSFISLL